MARARKLSLEVGAGDGGQRLDHFLVERCLLPETEARRLLRLGAVSVDGLRVKSASRPLREGQRVVAVVDEGPAILFEDEHLIAVDKPTGVAAHGTPDKERDDLLELVSSRLGREAGLVHRLDVETTGVTVFGKTPAATRSLAASFAEGRAHKRYLAVAFGALPDEGRIDLPISPDARRWGKFRALATGKLAAATRYRVLSRRGELCAVELLPETGRTHQIRVHLKALGAPIVGDRLYGGPTDLADRVMLHARSLQIPHPATGAPLTIVAPVPEDLRALLAAAGADLAKL